MKFEDSKERILDAATRVFAERGFHAATVRQICAAASMNVAMVKYYFGSKEKLYCEVVRRHFSFATADDIAKMADGVTDEASWREAVRRFVEKFAAYMSVTAKPGVYTARIFRWELTRPSSVSAELQMAYGHVVYGVLKKLFVMALGDDEHAVKMWCASVWSRLAILALVDEAWLRHFRPKGLSREAWVREVVESICASVFTSMSYRITARAALRELRSALRTMDPAPCAPRPERNS